MSEVQKASRQEYTIGRHGLKVPRVDMEDWYPSASGFFTRLWKYNGYGHVDRNGRFTLTEDLRRGIDLVLTTTADKPLINLRGSYRETSQAERDLQLARRSPWVTDRSVTEAIETHTILAAPTEGIQWFPILKYEKEYRTEELEDDPHEKTEYRGLPVTERDIFTPPKTADESVEAYGARIDAAFAEHVRELLARTVEVVS